MGAKRSWTGEPSRIVDKTKKLVDREFSDENIGRVAEELLNTWREWHPPETRIEVSAKK